MWRTATMHDAVPEMATITYVIILYAWVRKMMILGLGLVSARLAFPPPIS
jgi:hypothetical protein